MWIILMLLFPLAAQAFDKGSAATGGSAVAGLAAIVYAASKMRRKRRLTKIVKVEGARHGWDAVRQQREIKHLARRHK